MDIILNKWFFTTCLLLVTPCCPGVEAEGDGEDSEYMKTPQQSPPFPDLSNVMNLLTKLIMKMQELECGDYIQLEDDLKKLHIGGYDARARLFHLLIKGLEQAPQCMAITNEKSGKKCPDCDMVANCTDARNGSNVSASRKDSTSAGTSVLLFLVGLVVGLVTSSLVCICCPATHTKAANLLSVVKHLKVTKPEKSVSGMSLNEARDEEAVPSSVAGDVTGSRDNRQSNMYNEPDLYNEVNCGGEGHSYDTTRNQPVLERTGSSGYNHLHTGPANVSENTPKHMYSKLDTPDTNVGDPNYGTTEGHTYQPFIPEGNQNGNYSALQMDGQINTVIHPKFDTTVQDTMPVEEPHDYFTLEVTGDKASDTNPGPGTDEGSPETAGHEYFVLEAQNSGQ